MPKQLLKSAPLLCFIAMMFYAMEMSVADIALSRLNPRFLTMCYAGGVFLLSLIAIVIRRQEAVRPTRKQWVFIVLMVIVSFVAASAHFRALHAHSGAVKLSLFYCLLPVVTALFSAIFERKTPTRRKVAAWVLGAMALCLVSMGGEERPPDGQAEPGLLENAVLLCLIAMLFYGMELSIADIELSDLPPRFLTLCYSAGVFLLSLTAVLWNVDDIQAPTGSQWGFIGLMVLVSFVAATAHFSALHEHSGAVRLSLFYCLLPVATALLSAIFEHKMPTIYLIGAWLLAGTAVYAISTEKEEPNARE